MDGHHKVTDAVEFYLEQLQQQAALAAAPPVAPRHQAIAGHSPHELANRLQALLTPTESAAMGPPRQMLALPPAGGSSQAF